MTARILQIESIVSDPNVRAGQPIIAGTTIRISDLVSYQHAEALSPEQLAESFDLDLAQVYAALAFYHQNKDSIDTEIRGNEKEAEHWQQVLNSQGRSRILA